MRAPAAAAALLLVAALATAALPEARAQVGSAGSPFEREYLDVRFLDAYFGTADGKMEVSPGDSNAPFTVVLANVGSLDIAGIGGQLSMVPAFAPSGGGTSASAAAERGSSARAGESFSLTFFVDVDPHAATGSYPASVLVEYSRVRESGKRSSSFQFDFRLTGDSVINMRAADPFLTTLRSNHVVVEVANDGTAAASGVDVELQAADPGSGAARQATNAERVVLLGGSWELGNLEPGGSKYLEFDVYVPSSLRGETFRVPMRAAYLNAHGEREEVTRTVDFYAKGMVDASIYNVGVIELSGRQTVVGEIINEGNEDALFGFVTVEPLNGSNVSPVTQFIDEIEVDSPVPFNVPVEFDGDPVYGDHDILVTVRYKDSLREEAFLEHAATVTLLEPEAEEEPRLDLGLGFTVSMETIRTVGVPAAVVLVALLVCAAVGISAYRRVRDWRRRRRGGGDPDQDDLQF